MTHHSGKQGRKTGLLCGALILLSASLLLARPSGNEILAQAREMIRTQEIAISGKIRTGPSNIPFRLVQQNSVATYTFQDPVETVTVAMDESGVKLSAQAGGTPIRGSVLTYDDLALRFLYWTRIEDLGSEKVRSLPCWILRLDAPARTSPYAFVKLWVNQQSGAFLRAQAFDWKGLPAKQFDVVSTQTIDGRYFLKRMKIQLAQPVAEGAATLSYLEIDKPT